MSDEYDEPELSYNIKSIKPTNTHSIIKQLECINIPERIKDKAEEIRKKMNIKTRRGANLKYLIFFCIYNAYIELDETCNILDITKLCGIQFKDINKALKAYPYVKTGYKPIDDNNGPIQFINTFYHLTGLHLDQKSELIDLIKRIIYKSPDLDDDNSPQLVALGTMMYYLELNGIDKKIDVNLVGYSINNVIAMKKKIEQIINK